VATSATGDGSSQPRYVLRSTSQAHLFLHSPLRSSRRAPRHINLVSDSSVALPSMAGDDKHPVDLTDSQKIDWLVAQLSTMNSRMTDMSTRLAQFERTLDDNDDNGGAFHQRVPHRGGGRGRGGDGGFPGGRDDDRHAGSRLPKISFPKYDGESDPLTWLTKCESYFRGMRTLEMEKVWLASLHLDGIAAQWYYTVERDHDIISWARFADFVNLRFGPPIRANGLAELKDLHRTGSVEEYQQQFLALLCRCDGLSVPQQINLFTAGLGQPLRTDVELQAPTNLQTAMSLARAYEQRTAASGALVATRTTSRAQPSHKPSATTAASSTPAPASTTTVASTASSRPCFPSPVT